MLSVILFSPAATADKTKTKEFQVRCVIFKHKPFAVVRRLILNVFLFFGFLQPAVVHLQGQETTIQVREGKDVHSGGLLSVFSDWDGDHLSYSGSVIANQACSTQSARAQSRCSEKVCFATLLKTVSPYGAVEANSFSLTLRLIWYRRSARHPDTSLLFAFIRL